MADIQGFQIKEGKHKKKNRKHLTADAEKQLRILDYRSQFS
jgi:hypothetical protein